MSWSAVGRAALKGYGLPSPHLRISLGLESYDLSIDGEDKLIPISSCARKQIAAWPPLQNLLRAYPEWRVLIRIASDSGRRLSTIRLGVEAVDIPAGVYHSMVIAAILEASPMAAPNLHVANCPACEMVSHVKTWSKDMEPAASEDLGTFQDGFWEAILEDPRPGFDEALFVEDVLVAMTVHSQSTFSLRAFNTLSRDGFHPHPQSNAPLINKEFMPGFQLIRQHLGRRTRYLRLAFRGHATLHGVEAFCIELLPPHGPMPQTLRTVAKVFEAEPAVAIKQDEKYQTFTYSTLSNDLATISLHLRSRLDLDHAIRHDQDAMLAWCGSTRVEAFLLFLVSMMNQWCFVSLHRHALSSELKLLPELQLLVVEDGAASPGKLNEVKCLVLRLADIQDLARQSATSMPEPPAAQPHRVGNLIFTSGTTGSPKAVRRSHEELYAFLWLYAKSATPDSPCHLAYQPYSHMNEQLGTAVAFLQGSCIAFSSPETAHADAKAIGPTAIQGVPRFYEPLLNAYETKEMTLEELRGSLGSRVQRVAVGSAPVSARLLEFLKKCFESESCSVTNGYGATEVGPIAHNGCVNPNVEVRIVPCVELGHDEGGSIGEIRVRCKNERVQARGYVGASLNLDNDGYYCTGDIGRLEEGRLELLGRRGNVTKLANGFFVSAETLEEKYVSFMRELDQVFIMAIPSDSTVSAACVQRPWSLLSQSQILSAMQKTARENGLATHEIVSEVHLEPQPWTAENGGLLENQKLNRRALMDRYGQKMGAVPKDSMEIVRRCAEALRRGVKLPVAQPEVLEADLAAIPVATGSGISADVPSGSRVQLQRFFVTGSTGLLGRELVQELLAMGKDVVALVRRRCPNLPESVEQVVGDVSQVNLGADLSGLTFDAVWHSAAEVNWALSYAELRKSNVVGTWQVAQLCAERGVPLFFVSTISVAGKYQTLQPPEALSNGYVLSKLAAERFVHRAFGKGLKGAVFRPGMLWGSSKTGRGHPNFFPTRFVSGSSRVRCLPDSASKCDVTPVDYAAKVMIKACLLHQEVPRDDLEPRSHDSTYSGKVFHVFNPRSLSYSEMARLMDLEAVAVEDYWRKVMADVGNPMAPLYPLLQGGLPCASDWGDESVRQALGDSYAPPEITKELLQVYLQCSQI